VRSVYGSTTAVTHGFGRADGIAESLNHCFHNDRKKFKFKLEIPGKSQFFFILPAEVVPSTQRVNDLYLVL